MIDAVRVAYTALRSQPPPLKGDLAVLPLESVGGVFVGIDEHSRQHLLLEAGSETPPASDVATLAIGTRALVIAGRETTFLDITCLFDALGEVFDHFVVAVLERVATTDESAAGAVRAVLEKWREFLIAAAEPPGRDKLAAVFGELLVVLDVVLTSGKPGVGFWVGPFGGRHDVRSGTTALEVKTTRSHTSRQVTIHGEDQLVAPDAGQLFLHLVRIEQVPGGGRSVSSVVDELLAAGVPAETLFEAIAAAGVPLAELAATADVTFDVRERLTVPVDDRTPRIVPSSFVDGQRPAGVIDLSYTIDLDHCLDFALTEAAYTELLRSLAVYGAG